MNFKNQVNLIYIQKYLIFFLPISLVIGSAAININVILIDTLFLIFFFLKKIHLAKIVKKVLILIFLFLLMNNLFSLDNQLSLRGSLGFIKYVLLFLALVTFFEQNFIHRNIFYKIILYTVLAVSIDTLIQYSFGTSITGSIPQDSHGYRLSGPFGTEYVVGAFLSKLLYIGIIAICLNSKKNIYSFLYLIWIIGVIFLTNERSSFYVSILSLFGFMILFRVAAVTKFIVIGAVISLGFILSTSDPGFKNKYINSTIHEFGLDKKTHIVNEDKSIEYKSFLDSRYGAHFLTAYEIFKDHYIIGSGIKTFRKVCEYKKYENINSQYSFARCNTHPHNFYLEILSETGAVIFISFIIFIGSILIRLLQNYIKDKHTVTVASICLCFVLFWPIQTTGSFFSTFNGVFYFIGLAVIFLSNNMKLLKN
jgi:O-antigen ligase